MRRAGRIGGIGGALIIVLGAPAWGSDPPDSRVNPVSGRVETTDSYLGAVGYDVRHVEDQGPGQGRLLTVLSLHEGPEQRGDDPAPTPRPRPRIALFMAGLLTDSASRSASPG